MLNRGLAGDVRRAHLQLGWYGEPRYNIVSPKRLRGNRWTFVSLSVHSFVSHPRNDCFSSGWPLAMREMPRTRRITRVHHSDIMDNIERNDVVTASDSKFCMESRDCGSMKNGDRCCFPCFTYSSSTTSSRCLMREVIFNEGWNLVSCRESESSLEFRRTPLGCLWV